MCYTVIHLTIYLIIQPFQVFVTCSEISENIYKIHKSGTSQHTADAGESRTSYTGGDPELPTERPGTHFFIFTSAEVFTVLPQTPFRYPPFGNLKRTPVKDWWWDSRLQFHSGSLLLILPVSALS